MLKNIVFLVLFVTLTLNVWATDPIVTESTSTSTVNSNSNATTTVRSPPASAISPTINTSNSDLCTVGVAAAVQTQILGISGGSTVRDMNCERLKISKTLYDMGMKVAAVSAMCQDQRVFDAMMNAGTPCPIDGMIGQEAKVAWKTVKETNSKEETSNETKKWSGGLSLGALLLLLLL